MQNTIPIDTKEITKYSPRLTFSIDTPITNTECRYKTYFRKSIVANNYIKKIQDDLSEFLTDIRILLNHSPSKDTILDVTLVDSDRFSILTDYTSSKKDSGSLGYFQPKFVHNTDNTFGPIEQLRIVTSMYTLSTLVHECGHMLDCAYGVNPRLSDLNDFKQLHDEYIDAVDIINESDVFEYTVSTEYMEYLKNPTEIYARCFQTWYCKVIQPTKSNPNFFKDLENDTYFGVGEAASEFLFNVKPELFSYFDKKYGLILENEKAISLAQALGTLDTTPIFQQ